MKIIGKETNDFGATSKFYTVIEIFRPLKIFDGFIIGNFFAGN